MLGYEKNLPLSFTSYNFSPLANPLSVVLGNCCDRRLWLLWSTIVIVSNDCPLWLSLINLHIVFGDGHQPTSMDIIDDRCWSTTVIIIGQLLHANCLNHWDRCERTVLNIMIVVIIISWPSTIVGHCPLASTTAVIDRQQYDRRQSLSAKHL